MEEGLEISGSPPPPASAMPADPHDGFGGTEDYHGDKEDDYFLEERELTRVECHVDEDSDRVCGTQNYREGLAQNPPAMAFHGFNHTWIRVIEQICPLSSDSEGLSSRSRTRTRLG